ncbi:Zinc import ATP-binding protein ZnuC [Candidatus Xenohaliotis californiensis]|uniref:Zinc import ATP-binding protein ZnuC n=1 Tax=Candidatus Xenohaliotis californiensis TaxID=84677 RepID=A0ABP0EU52_9RICK|nr:Zinc import ATP-binding protein ZnuC [Candidatus Xenohaliotis californiensis]
MKKSSMHLLLHGKNLCLKLGHKEVLNSINIKICKNEITAVIGPNGGGKTSLLKILCGIIEPLSGQILKKNNLIIGYIPQKINICTMMPLSVKEFINLNNQNTNKEWGDKIFNLTNIRRIMDCRMHCLSGGEMQRVLLVRAMLKKPDILIMDEPTNHMDIHAKNNFYNLLHKIHKLWECGIVYSSHDVSTAMDQANHVLCINKYIRCQGCPREVRCNPNFLNAFDMLDSA